MAAWRKPPSGVSRSKRTVRSSMAVIVTSRHEPAAGPVYVGSWSVWTVNTTSADVTGSASCHTASGRNVNVYEDPLSPIVQVDARSGSTDPFGPRRTRPLKTSATMSRSACVRAVSGLIDAGRPTIPSR